MSGDCDTCADNAHNGNGGYYHVVVTMGILTEREKEILKHLREGETVMQVARSLRVPVTSVSRSITSIKRKAKDMEEDIAFLQQVGYLSLSKGHIAFTAPDRDPKALSKLR